MASPNYIGEINCKLQVLFSSFGNFRKKLLGIDDRESLESACWSSPSRDLFLFAPVDVLNRGSRRLVMQQEHDQLIQAILIASDPGQASLHHQALDYLSTIQDDAPSTWKVALSLFVESTPEGTRKYPTQARFWALRILDEFLDNR